LQLMGKAAQMAARAVHQQASNAPMNGSRLPQEEPEAGTGGPA